MIPPETQGVQSLWSGGLLLASIATLRSQNEITYDAKEVTTHTKYIIFVYGQYKRLNSIYTIDNRR